MLPTVYQTPYPSLRNFDTFDRLFNPLNKGDMDIPLEIFQRDEEWLVKAYLPGLKKEDIHVDVEAGKISISAVRHKPQEKIYLTEVEYGEFKTTISVGGLNNIKQDNVSAKYEDGVLFITVKKDKEQIPYGVQID